MDDIVDRVLPRWISKGIEESKVVVGARIDGKVDSCSLVVGIGGSLGTADWARVSGIANGELVVVLGEGLEASCFDLKLIRKESRPGASPRLPLGCNQCRKM